MNYGFGKTYKMDSMFTALNGCAFFYELTANVDLVAAEGATEVEKAVAEANMLRVLETLRGAQPVLVSAAGKVLKFTLEQAYTFGDNSVQQVSRHGEYKEEAKKVIAKLFKDESCGFEMKALKAEDETVEVKDLVLVDSDVALINGEESIEVKDIINM